METIGRIELQLFFLIAPSVIALFCVWKFYQMLSRINDNIAGIRQAVEGNVKDRPIPPADTRQ